ncbi:MAG: arylsulfatase [Verrucomicrobiota bacterium]
MKIPFSINILFCMVLVAHGTKKPNIIYILADDLGYGDLGCYGQAVIQTPHIDQLRSEGMRFTNHHSGSTVCAPSRVSFLTGKHMGNAYVRGNGSIRLREDPNDITVARLLKDAGYHTAMIGKAGTGAVVPPGHPNRKGFDYFFGQNRHGAAHYYFPESAFRNAEKITYPNNKKTSGDTYIHDEYLKEILQYLEERSGTGQPFFLHYGAQIPHAQMHVPEEWVAQYRGKVGADTPVERGKRKGLSEEPKATFAGMVSRFDWEIGEIVSQLKKLGILENTVIMFSSDNGPHGEGGQNPKWFNSGGGLRGMKRDLFEGGLRVPMIVRWDGHVAPGSETDHLSAFWDILPTLCEIAQIEAPSDTDGISFLPTLLGDVDSQKQHEYLYWEFHEGVGSRAALTHRWKAVQRHMNKPKIGQIMLFDIQADPAEQNDLSVAHPEIVEHFVSLFEEAHTPTESYSWGNVAK